jgi:uncharacterized repeat protein (TIGR01451 family)
METLPPVPLSEIVPVEAPQSPFPYGTSLSTFLGSSPNGYWSLWAICDETLDSGYISNGWVLNINTGVPVENDADLEVTVTTNAQPTAGNPLIYYVAVTNYGPAGATNVVITDYLPAGTTYTNNPETNGILTVSLSSLAVGAGTSFAVLVAPTNLGYITNIVTALALEPDPNTNNMVTNVNLVGLPSADLGITLTASQNQTLAGGEVIFTSVITNVGPSDAANVVAVLTLPPGFVTNGISLTSGTATYANGAITWTNIGDLADGMSVGGVQTITVGTVVTTGGGGTATASVSSSTFDPFKGNNSAQVTINVSQALLSVASGTRPYQLTWSPLATNYTLQGAVNLPPPGASNLWMNIPTSNGQYIFTLPGTNGYHFFRLKSQLP